MYAHKCVRPDCVNTAAYTVKKVRYRESGKVERKILTRPTVPDDKINLCLMHARKKLENKTTMFENDPEFERILQEEEEIERLSHTQCEYRWDPRGFGFKLDYHAHRCSRMQFPKHTNHACMCGAENSEPVKESEYDPEFELSRENIKEFLEGLMKSPATKEPRPVLGNKCPFCGKQDTVPMTIAQYVEFFYLPAEISRHIQDIFPELTPSERERLQTGICDSCWSNVL